MNGARPAPDAFDARRAQRADGPLRAFNDAGVLAAADVHVARRLCELAEAADAQVALAAALAVRAPRLGHVLVDLATIHATATVESDEPVDLTALPWPDAGPWVERLAASPLVAVGEDGAHADRPLRLVGSRLYLDRYWREERRLAADLLALAADPPEDLLADVLADGLERLFPGAGDEGQRLAAASALLRRLAVVAGGPGTGKTTTVARIVALLFEQARAAGRPAPLVALAAPTGKAAARLQEAVHEQAAALPVDPVIRVALRDLGAATLHRLLGARPGTSRLRHHRANRLPHDVVIVDESSMVSLSQMARLVEAVRRDARLVLVGDPGQLTSIEAGAVLGDLVGPAAERPRMRLAARAVLAAAARVDVDADDAPYDGAIGDGVIVLEREHRYGGAIAQLARAVRRGDADAALAVLAGGHADVRWLDVDIADPAAGEALALVRERATAAALAVAAAAAVGDAAGAIAALAGLRVLCAHRRGPYGVATWAERIDEWRRAATDAPEGSERGWYVGRPLLVTENDHLLRLYNGDTGVVVADASGGMRAAFERGGEIVHYSPARLAAIETVYAMTIHKSQGSQFDSAIVLLSDDDSPILTRELLYTAITRARTHLLLAGTADAIQAAIARPVARASGLRARLWGDDA